MPLTPATLGGGFFFTDNFKWSKIYFILLYALLKDYKYKIREDAYSY